MAAPVELNLTERWRSVLHWEDTYEVSDYGQVRSIPREIIRRDGRVYNLPGKLIVPTPNKYGKHAVGLHREGKRVLRLVCHLVLEAFVGPRPEGLVACHGERGITDDSVENLRWDTQSANMLDKQRDGTDHQRNKRECPREHLLVMPNLVKDRYEQGHRVCLACTRTYTPSRQAERSGISFDFRAEADAHYARIMGAALWTRLSKAEQIVAAKSFAD